VFPIPDYYCDCCACSTMDNIEPDQKKVKVDTPVDGDAEGKGPTGFSVETAPGVIVKHDEEKVHAKTESLDDGLGKEAIIEGKSEASLQETGMQVGEIGQGLEAKVEPRLDLHSVKEEPTPVDTPNPVGMDVVKEEPGRTEQ